MSGDRGAPRALPLQLPGKFDTAGKYIRRGAVGTALITITMYGVRGGALCKLCFFIGAWGIQVPPGAGENRSWHCPGKLLENAGRPAQLETGERLEPPVFTYIHRLIFDARETGET